MSWNNGYTDSLQLSDDGSKLTRRDKPDLIEIGTRPISDGQEQCPVEVFRVHQSHVLGFEDNDACRALGTILTQFRVRVVEGLPHLGEQ